MSSSLVDTREMMIELQTVCILLAYHIDIAIVKQPCSMTVLLFSCTVANILIVGNAQQRSAQPLLYFTLCVLVEY